MLVSAAMADRPRATAPAGSRRAPAPEPAAAARHSTARVATTAGVRKSELPGWFWGALGCMTVLVVGLAIVFILGQSSGPAPGSSAPGALTAPATAAAAAPAAADGLRAPGMKIEPMAAPAAPAAVRAPAAAAAPAAHPKTSGRPIKVARSPAGGGRPTVAAKPSAGGADQPAADGDSDEEELLKPRPRAAAPADDEKSDDGN